jgi:O-antigen/teichoic acid export membrane protein
VVFNVVFPRMTAQVAARDESGLRQNYHNGSQLMAVIVLPIAAVLSFFSFEILRLWTRNNEMAAFAAPILSILVIGSALNALLFLPYAVQLAFGWTKLNFMAGLVSLAIIIPVIVPITKYFGPVGAAAVWAVLNFLNILIVVPIMHRRILRQELWAYYGDIGFPLIVVLGMTLLARLAFANLRTPGSTAMALIGAWLSAFGAAAIAAPGIRSWILKQFANFKLERVKHVRSPV